MCPKLIPGDAPSFPMPALHMCHAALLANAPKLRCLTNDSKATVSVLYWYGNYPTLTEHVSDFLDSGLALALGQIFVVFPPTPLES